MFYSENFPSPFSNVVARIVFVTLSMCARTEGCPSMSVRINTIPVFSGAGLKPYSLVHRYEGQSLDMK